MANGDNIQIRCPRCSGTFLMSRPPASGKYRVTCPFCGASPTVTYKAPARQQTPVQPVQPVQQQMPKPATPLPPPVPGPAPVQTPPPLSMPSTPRATQRTGEMPQDPEATRLVGAGPGGRLVLRRAGRPALAWSLREGSQIVGREDVDKSADIAIPDDPTISRHSLEITGIPGQTGWKFRIRVIRSLNPVLRNAHPVAVDVPEFLNFGDTIQIGLTTLHLEEDK